MYTPTKAEVLAELQCNQCDFSYANAKKRECINARIFTDHGKRITDHGLISVKKISQ